MLLKCSECGGKVSDKATACPHCGAPVDAPVDTPATPKHRNRNRQSACPECGRPYRENDSEEEEDSSLPPPRKGFDFVALFLSFMKFCFFLLTVLILAGAIGFFVFRYDIGGAASKLRSIAESDAGDGSHIDNSNARVLFKYRLASFLDSVQGKAKKSIPSTPSEPGSSVENAIQLPDAKSENDSPAPENLPTDKVERKPIELPPPPPEENNDPEKIKAPEK